MRTTFEIRFTISFTDGSFLEKIELNPINDNYFHFALLRISKNSESIGL